MAQPQYATADRHKISRIPWAELLLRVFREDVLLCPCGGRRVVLAFITEKKVVRAILERLGLPGNGAAHRAWQDHRCRRRCPLAR
jgi:hypothetical protein